MEVGNGYNAYAEWCKTRWHACFWDSETVKKGTHSETLPTCVITLRNTNKLVFLTLCSLAHPW